MCKHTWVILGEKLFYVLCFDRSTFKLLVFACTLFHSSRYCVKYILVDFFLCRFLEKNAKRDILLQSEYYYCYHHDHHCHYFVVLKTSIVDYYVEKPNTLGAPRKQQWNNQLTSTLNRFILILQKVILYFTTDLAKQKTPAGAASLCKCEKRTVRPPRLSKQQCNFC